MITIYSQPVSLEFLIMTTFHLKTTWKIPASIEACWFSILDVEAWPDWWKYVDEVVKVNPGDVTSINSIHKYSWSTLLPYQLVFELRVTQFIPYQRIAFDAKGDLKGNGYCQFIQKNKMTHILFDWNVETNKAWMRSFTNITYPIFKWNHKRVMQSGEQSLIQKLDPKR